VKQPRDNFGRVRAAYESTERQSGSAVTIPRLKDLMLPNLDATGSQGGIRHINPCGLTTRLHMLDQFRGVDWGSEYEDLDECQ
jgi:hypothetical protein